MASGRREAIGAGSGREEMRHTHHIPRILSQEQDKIDHAALESSWDSEVVMSLSPSRDLARVRVKSTVSRVGM